MAGHHGDRVVVLLRRLEAGEHARLGQQAGGRSNLLPGAACYHDAGLAAYRMLVFGADPRPFTQRPLRLRVDFAIPLAIFRPWPIGEQARLQAEALHHRAQVLFPELIARQVISGAHIPDIEHGEARLANGFGDPLRQVGVETGPPIGPGSARGSRDSAQVHGAFEVAQRRGRGDSVERRRHRVLAAGHAVVEIVGDDQRNADIAARDVEQVRTADAATAIALEHDDGQFGPRQLQPAGIGDRTAVQSVKGVGDEITIGQADAADVGDDDHFLRVGLQLHQRPVQRLDQPVVAAARAKRQGPDFIRQECLYHRVHRRPPRSMISSGEISVVSILLTPTTSTPAGANLSTSRMYWPIFISGTITLRTPSIADASAVAGTG